jgi:hypothetical protein
MCGFPSIFIHFNLGFYFSMPLFFSHQHLAVCKRKIEVGFLTFALCRLRSRIICGSEMRASFPSRVEACYASKQGKTIAYALFGEMLRS